MRLVISLLACAALTATGCTRADRPAVAAEAPRQSASEALATLFAEADSALLRRNPIEALSRGVPGAGAHLPDWFSEAYYAAERQAAERELAALERIDRADLTADERISYDVFKWQRESDLRGLQPSLLAISSALPIDHFNGVHALVAEISSGEGIAPFKTVQDYENSLTRMDDFASVLDRATGRMRQGMASGIVQPRIVVANVIEQLDAMLAEKPAQSAFFRPATRFPADVPTAEQGRLRAAFLGKIEGTVRPALQRLRTFMANEYLPRARESVGLGALPGDAQLYAHLVAVSTTTDLTPGAIHRIGLENVARIQGEMENVKRQVGFTGTLKQFFEHIRTDPRFKPKSREALQQGYVAIGARVASALPRLFSTMPKTRLDIRPVPALTEKGAARGSYVQGSTDGARPGVFYFNAYDLPSRTTPGMETLYLHEGAPGHHFQISLAQENKALPNFQRFGGNTAFVEGWGLYAETLGRELGVYTDPYQYFGYLDSQLFRAIRLVVDTGIHSKGWTRDQTIQYILDNSSRGRSNATAETERYIAMPGQALAYKIGQLKISELRARAEKALGPRFDIRQFHEQVLMSGALPLAVLERKIDDWIASKKST
ncbi:MAG TPA: DUF885 domain-containing protein [Allosphingosinicella sp.]|nr:DUF885 domain-containing protein [Allosphingosinicella sp.]